MDLNLSPTKQSVETNIEHKSHQNFDYEKLDALIQLNEALVNSTKNIEKVVYNINNNLEKMLNLLELCLVPTQINKERPSKKVWDDSKVNTGEKNGNMSDIKEDLIDNSLNSKCHSPFSCTPSLSSPINDVKFSQNSPKIPHEVLNFKYSGYRFSRHLPTLKETPLKKELPSKKPKKETPSRKKSPLKQKTCLKKVDVKSKVIKKASISEELDFIGKIKSQVTKNKEGEMRMLFGDNVDKNTVLNILDVDDEKELPESISRWISNKGCMDVVNLPDTYKPYLQYLSPEEHKICANVFSLKDKHLTIYQTRTYELTVVDVVAFCPGTWLSDKIIDTYLDDLRLSHGNCPKKFYLPTVFKSMVFNAAHSDNVLSYYKNNIQDSKPEIKDYIEKIYVPINDNLGNHWFILVIDTVEEKNYVLDSLGVNDHRQNIVTQLVENGSNVFKDDSVLEQLFLSARNFPVKYPLVPIQPNGTDCGMFLLKYAEAERYMDWFKTFTTEEMNIERLKLLFKLINSEHNEAEICRYEEFQV